MAPHDRCPQFLRRIAADVGLDVHVSTEPPLTDGPYPPDPCTCPHGTTYWIAPTGEQIAQWARDGVE